MNMMNCHSLLSHPGWEIGLANIDTQKTRIPCQGLKVQHQQCVTQWVEELALQMAAEDGKWAIGRMMPGLQDQGPDLHSQPDPMEAATTGEKSGSPHPSTQEHRIGGVIGNILNNVQNIMGGPDGKKHKIC